MNLYKFFKNPRSLLHYANRYEIVPDLALEQLIKQKDESQRDPKLLNLVANNSKAALQYAEHSRKPFTAGEDAIAKNAETSRLYAVRVLRGRFPKGEAAIATNAYQSVMYSNFLGERFKLGEPAIKNAIEQSHTTDNHINQYYDNYLKSNL